MSKITWDYVVVGGGVAGSVMASRLRQYNPSLNILLLEVGTDTRTREDIVHIDAKPIGTDLDWNVKTENIPGLSDRGVTLGQGKGLGGSAAINMAGWIRGSSHEYDDWAEVVGDDRWRFKNQLPYMKMSEKWFDKENPDIHGFSGPISISSPTSKGRHYPLRDALVEGWKELGLEALPSLDGHSGDNLGYAASNEARRDGTRQLPTAAYPMEGVTIRTATGVLLANGEEIHAKNVVSCAGAIQSPKILMLSGVGAKDELEPYGIKVKVDLPEVGKNLGDFLGFYQFWKLKHPEKGYTFGSSNPLFQQPNLEKLAKAIEKDEGVAPSADHPLLQKDRSFNELLAIYLAMSPSDPFGLRSSDVGDPPLITPKYLETEVDKYSFREGLRSMARMMLGTAFGNEHVAGETAPDDVEPITLDVSDEYLDERIADRATTSWHPHGGCSMGEVVDAEFRVRGFHNLFVVDSSVIPVALSAYLMAPVYAMAEQAAAILSGRG